MKIYSIRTYADILRETGLLVSERLREDTFAVEAITYDSKEAGPGTLFVCKGAAFKPEYLREAVQRGAMCYVSEKDYSLPEAGCLLVTDVRKAMALIADLFYDKAYQKLCLIGITGTKGKSTTAYYVKYILDEYLQNRGEKPSAIVSSIDTYDGKTIEESHLTTPEAFQLHRHFANAAESGIRFFEMEVSSQALKYDRVEGVEFDAGVFLNISEDHISPVEHTDFEDYFSSKLKLFAQSKLAVVNLQTEGLPRVLSAARESGGLLTFGLTPEADVYGYDIRKEGGEIRFRVRGPSFDEAFALTMPGLFNVENALAAIAVCSHFGIPTAQIRAGLYKARSKGRMECFEGDRDVTVIVDYAHNKLSFQRLYDSVREEYPGRKIVTVFGCPGGKAYNRRTELARLAGRYSSAVYLTMEDPGKESVHAISEEIESHLDNPACARFLIDDRGEAITQAIQSAGSGAVILITGKGSETRQKIGTEYVPCRTDEWYVQRALSRREAAERT